MLCGEHPQVDSQRSARHSSSKGELAWQVSLPSDLPIRKAEIIQVCGIRRLFEVSVHLVVGSKAPPASRNRECWSGHIYIGRHAIQRY